MTQTILITFAIPAEARPFQRRLPQPHPHLHLLVTGIGQRNAAAALRKSLTAVSPHLVLSCGFAGGLDPALRPGTVLFEADTDFPLTKALQGAGARPARFHCANRIVGTAQDKRILREETGADAVEMESAAIRKICTEAGISSATVRAISDTALETLPLDFNLYLDDMNRLRFAKMAAAIVLSPGRLRGSIQLQRQSQEAAANLARVLLRVTVHPETQAQTISRSHP
jgi:adenosylhomocysteine nucleosidase